MIIYLRSKETHRWNFLNIFCCFDVSDLCFSVKNPRGQVDNWTLNWYILIALITFEHCSNWNAYFIDKIANFFLLYKFLYAYCSSESAESRPAIRKSRFQVLREKYKFLCKKVLSLRLIFNRKARDRSGACHFAHWHAWINLSNIEGHAYLLFG